MSAESGSWAQYQKLVLKLLEQHDEKLEELSKKLAEDSGDHSQLTASLDNIKSEVSLLINIVRDGNTTSTPLVTRVNDIETIVKDMKLKMDEAEQAKKEHAKEAKTLKRSFFIAAAVFVLNLGWDVIKFFFMG